MRFQTPLFSPTMSTAVFPVSLYEGILPKLVAVLELTQDPAGVSNPQARQKLLQAVRPPNRSQIEVYQLLFLQTNNFKNAIAQAKDFAINLPGGELLIEEQDDIIQMLETLRDRKRYASFILPFFFFLSVGSHSLLELN